MLPENNVPQRVEKLTKNQALCKLFVAMGW